MTGERSKRHFAIALLAAGVCIDGLVHAQPVPGQSNQFLKGIRGLAENQKKPPSANSLLDADSDAERFRRLQLLGGGTDQQMWKIGQRYLSVYYAINDENWDLAEHHWGKIRDRLNVALMKRPNRTANAEGVFLEGPWTQGSQFYGAPNHPLRRRVAKVIVCCFAVAIGFC